MRKLFIIFIVISFTSCCATKHHTKDPVKSAVDRTIQDLIDKKIINY
jgi:hypothetical protein